MATNQLALGAATLFMIIGLSGFLWSMRPSSIGHRHTMLVFASLCIAITVTLVVFTIFPDTEASGRLSGVTLGGAGAFVILVWVAANRASVQAEHRDALEMAIRDRDRKIMELQQELAGLARRQRPRPVESIEIHRYLLAEVPAGSTRYLAIVTGDMRRVRCAEVWVNSENTDMQMARCQEHSISGLIRYESARRDGSGRVVDEPVLHELNRQTAGKRPVPAGTVIVTGAGGLGRLGVRHIAHVATVHSEPGGGFRQVGEIGRCVTNVLVEINGSGSGGSAKSVLFPLLGVGQGGGDVRHTAETMANAVVDFLTTAPKATVEMVYFLAYTDAELAACTAAFENVSRLVRVPRR